MKRLRLMLVNEFKLFKTAIPIHVVIALQPTVMYLLMSVILVHPTFDMNVSRPESREAWALVAAMEQVGSPIGVPYIRPVLVEGAGDLPSRQEVAVEERDGRATAVQRFGLIDSNMVKNFRNRLAAAALRLWNVDLGSRGVTIEDHPWLARDVPYSVYFGMAMLPLTACLVASVLGAVLTAQEFEFQTITEYRLSPVAEGLILTARLARLVLFALGASAVLLVTVGLRTGIWPGAVWRVILVLLPVSVAAGGLGILAGLAIRKMIPSFLVGLVTSFVGWILGSAFGLAAGFGRAYEFISQLTPNTHAVELLFPSYFGSVVGNPLGSALVLVLMSVVMVALTAMVYRKRVRKQG